MRKRLFPIFSLIIISLALSSCGYGFRGTVSYLPEEIKTVAIPFLVNQTGEPELELLITQALIREFNRSKLLKLVQVHKADVILQGRVKALRTVAAAYEDVRTALQRRITVTLAMELVKTRDKTKLWRNTGLTESQDYDVGADSVSTEANRAEAIEELAKNLAEKIHDSIFENF